MDVGPAVYDQVEYMAGRHECTKAAWECGRAAFAFEISESLTPPFRTDILEGRGKGMGLRGGEVGGLPES
eukprot:3610503-Pyramimonas_sp.AAC.1